AVTPAVSEKSVMQGRPEDRPHTRNQERLALGYTPPVRAVRHESRARNGGRGRVSDAGRTGATINLRTVSRHRLRGAGAARVHLRTVTGPPCATGGRVTVIVDE